MDKKTAITRIVISFTFFAIASMLFSHYVDYGPSCSIAGTYAFIIALTLAAFYYDDGDLKTSEKWSAAGYGIIIFFSLAAFLTFERVVTPSLWVVTYTALNKVVGWAVVLGILIGALSIWGGSDGSSDKKDKPKKDDDKGEKEKKRKEEDAAKGALLRELEEGREKAKKATEELRKLGHNFGGGEKNKPEAKKKDGDNEPKGSD